MVLSHIILPCQRHKYIFLYNLLLITRLDKTRGLYCNSNSGQVNYKKHIKYLSVVSFWMPICLNMLFIYHFFPPSYPCNITVITSKLYLYLWRNKKRKQCIVIKLTSVKTCLCYFSTLAYLIAYVYFLTIAYVTIKP